ncbi:MBL fold metallo-hydrolase [Endothiovibrio diazotrophicus]
MFEILHHGATRGVTGSCHELVVSDDESVLVDCGLFQGDERGDGGGSAAGPEIDFDLRRVRALVVTHCHLDHCGRLPYLLAAGFDGPIYCSEPTALLLPEMLEDALKIGFTRDRRLIERVLELIRSRLRPLPYGRRTSIGKTAAALELTLQPAGHILGSAYLRFRLRDAGGRPWNVLFSGDLGAPYTPLLPAPRVPYGCDQLVLESTYGDRLHEGRKARRERLRSVVERSLRDRGTILIPAFSIGRTQELLYELEQLIHRHRDRRLADGMVWDDLEVVVDSPLAARFTAGYRALAEYWDREAKRRRAAGRHPLAFEQVTVIDDHADHLRTVEYLRRRARPCVVIAGGGMCSGGRIVNYLKALLGDSRTDVLFVGYQAAGTPGRTIQRYGPRHGWVELDGERYDIAAGVHTLSGYSAHADRDDLIRFVRRMRRKPREIRLVHGDDEAKRALAGALRPHCPGAEIVVPG